MQERYVKRSQPLPHPPASPVHSIRARAEEKGIFLLEGVGHNSLGQHVKKRPRGDVIHHVHLPASHIQGEDAEREARAVSCMQHHLAMVARLVRPNEKIDTDSSYAHCGSDRTSGIPEVIGSFSRGELVVVDEWVFIVGDVLEGAHANSPTVAGKFDGGEVVNRHRDEIQELRIVDDGQHIHLDRHRGIYRAVAFEIGPRLEVDLPLARLLASGHLPVVCAWLVNLEVRVGVPVDIVNTWAGALAGTDPISRLVAEGTTIFAGYLNAFLQGTRVLIGSDAWR